MKVQFVSIITACLLLVGCSASISEAEKAGAQSAERWLTIVDRGAFKESWVESATLLQSKVSQSEWVKMLGNARQPFGANLSRTLEKAEYTSTLSGAPDGKYVVATFESSFEQKANAVETVTVALSDEGKWKVAGYFIK
jgi:hypothetical protein